MPGQPEPNTAMLSMAEFEEYADLWFLLFDQPNPPRSPSELPADVRVVPRELLHLLREWAKAAKLDVDQLKRQRERLGI